MQEEGYEVTTASNGRDALMLFQHSQLNEQNFPFDLVILDLMLPYVNGLGLCRLLRHQGHAVPILIVSARASEGNRVLGLEMGADDYLTKPFSLREFIARCRSLLHRQNLSHSTDTKLQFEEIEIHLQEHRVFVRGKEVTLSLKEFRLLELILSSPHRVWTREELLDQVWGPEPGNRNKTLAVHICWLRQKLEPDPKQHRYIKTVPKVGYRFG